jgi:tetratricopeptide (TPR) repeat protein
MSGEPRELHPIKKDGLMALAAGKLSDRKAAVALAHMKTCSRCRELFSHAEAIQEEAEELRAADVDDVTRGRMWQALEQEAEAAAKRVRRRRAAGILWKDPAIRSGSIAAGIALLVGAGLLVYRFASTEDRAKGSREAQVADALDQRRRPPGTAEPRAGTRHVEGTRALDGTGMGPAELPRRTRRASSGRERSPAVAARTGLRLRSGERLLKCGAALAVGSARASVVRDTPTTAVVRVAAGQVGLRVPKLPEGGRLEVVTSDARVRVKGTLFTVQRRTDSTTVKVREGVVWVMPTGRNRKTVVLGAGQQETVLGEGPYLKLLLSKMQAALSGGRLAEAARLGQRYLAVTSTPSRASSLRLKLAGILARLSRFNEAIRLYLKVAGSAGHAVARQNALAFLARLYRRRKQMTKAVETWHALVTRYPGGIYERDALTQLVRATCRKTSARAVKYRKKLAKRFPKHRSSKTLLKKCRP